MGDLYFTTIGRTFKVCQLEATSYDPRRVCVVKDGYLQREVVLSDWHASTRGMTVCEIWATDAKRGDESFISCSLVEFPRAVRILEETYHPNREVHEDKFLARWYGHVPPK